MPRDKYTLQQRIFMYDLYVITSSCREVRQRFLTEFPEVRLPSREAVRKLVNKLRETGSILDKKRRVKRRVLTEEKVGEVGERLEHSPQKSLLRIAQETAISMTSAWRATKLLKLKPYMRIKKKEKRNGPANKQKGAAENDTSTEIGKEVDENETEFVADQAQMTVSRSSQDTTVCTSVCKTEMHTLGEISIKTELTDETHTESKNCVLGI
ncbi:uncharacterized protein [Periplaneta americana]|uniref:uncharacterized protein isoform X3 n=1 Tax=Periplaneta americana TaxID=6978 RepID=UPI0037E7D8BB